MSQPSRERGAEPPVSASGFAMGTPEGPGSGTERVTRAETPSWFRRHAWGLSNSLLVVGAVLLVFGTLFAWAEATFFDSDGFADAASDSLQNDAVQARLASRLTDRVVADDPDRERVRPLINGASAAILDSSQFKSIFREAVRTLHQLIFDEDRGDLVLDLTAALAQIVELVRIAAPQLAERIPENLESGLITISENDIRARLIELSDRVSFLAFVLPALSLAAFGGALYVSPDRVKATFRLGMCIAIAAAIVLLALLLVRFVIGETVRDPANSDAAGGIWWAFADTLRTTMRVIALAGIALAAGAWWVGNKGWPWAPR